MKKISKILEYIDKHGISKAQFEREFGLSNGYLSKTVDRETDITEKVLDKIKERDSSAYSQIFEEPEGTYLSKRRDLKNNVAKPSVPVFGGFTTLGNIEVYDDDGMRNQVIAKLPAEVFPGCDYAEKAKGDSMYPLIMNQAYRRKILPAS